MPTIPGGFGCVLSEGNTGLGHAHDEKTSDSHAHDEKTSDSGSGSEHDTPISVTFHNHTAHPVAIDVPGSGVPAGTAPQAGSWKLDLPLDSKAAGNALVEALISGPTDRAVMRVESKPQAKWFSSQGSAPQQSREWTCVEWKEPAPLPFFGVQTRPARGTPDGSTIDVHVLLFNHVDAASWMSRLPGSTPLSALCLPGTHESLSRSGYPASACQSSEATVTKQLHDGIRFLDIRVIAKPPDGGDSAEVDPKQQKLYAYHGIINEKIELGEALKQLYDFLAPQGPGHGECVFVSMKPEGDARIMQGCFEHVYLNPARDRWYLEPKVPSLSEARGKLILVSRYGSSGDQPGGIHPPMWPNSSKEIFSYTLPSGQKVTTQDWYGVGSLSRLGDKFELVKALLAQAGSDPATLALDFVSVASLPWALPPYGANGALWYKGLNLRLRDYVCELLLLQQQRRAAEAAGTPSTVAPLMATFNLDFYDYEPDLVPLLVQSNFAA